MSQRLGLLFADSSLLVLPEGTDVDAAWREAEEHDAGELNPRTEVVRLDLEIVEHYNRRLGKLRPDRGSIAR
jgi:hypothetical protein